MLAKSRIAKDVLGLAALMAAAALLAWHCAARIMLPANPHDAGHTAQADFRDVIYYPTRAMLAGVNPYDSREDNPDSYRGRFPVGNNFPLYSPLIFVPALPFAALPLWTSVVAWWLANVGTGRFAAGGAGAPAPPPFDSMSLYGIWTSIRSSCGAPEPWMTSFHSRTSTSSSTSIPIRPYSTPLVSSRPI